MISTFSSAMQRLAQHDERYTQLDRDGCEEKATRLLLQPTFLEFVKLEESTLQASDFFSKFAVHGWFVSSSP